MVRLANPDLATVIEIYYSCAEIGNSEIKRLWGGKISRPSIVKLKNLAREQMREDNKPALRPNYVHMIESLMHNCHNSDGDKLNKIKKLIEIIAEEELKSMIVGR